MLDTQQRYESEDSDDDEPSEKNDTEYLPGRNRGSIHLSETPRWITRSKASGIDYSIKDSTHSEEGESMLKSSDPTSIPTREDEQPPSGTNGVLQHLASHHGDATLTHAHALAGDDAKMVVIDSEPASPDHAATAPAQALYKLSDGTRVDRAAAEAELARLRLQCQRVEIEEKLTKLRRG